MYCLYMIKDDYMLVRHYSYMVKRYAYIVALLTDLLKKDYFLWTTEATTTFLPLKNAMRIRPKIPFM